MKLRKPLVVTTSIKLRKPLAVTFKKHLPFVMSTSMNALVEKIITRHLAVIMGLAIIAQTQIAKTQVVGIQVAIPPRVVVAKKVTIAQKVAMPNQVVILV